MDKIDNNKDIKIIENLPVKDMRYWQDILGSPVAVPIPINSGFYFFLGDFFGYEDLNMEKVPASIWAYKKAIDYFYEHRWRKSRLFERHLPVFCVVLASFLEQEALTLIKGRKINLKRCSDKKLFDMQKEAYIGGVAKYERAISFMLNNYKLVGFLDAFYKNLDEFYKDLKEKGDPKGIFKV